MTVRNVINGGIVGYDGLAQAVFTAPAGASLAGAQLSLKAVAFRGDGQWQLGLFDASSGSNGPMLSGCGTSTGICAWATEYGNAPGWISLNGITKLSLKVQCKAIAGCDTSSTGIYPYTRAQVNMYSAEVRVQDSTTPALNITGGGLTSSGYKKGTQSLTVSSSDNVGVRDFRYVLDGGAIDSHHYQSCDYTRPVPCPASQGDTFSLDTSDLAEGSHTLIVNAIDTAGNARGTTVPFIADNKAPGQVDVTVDQGEDWVADNGFSVHWTNPASTSPIAAAHYSACKANDPNDCVTTNTRVAGSDITSIAGIDLPAAGDYVLRVWLEDAAGNVDPQTASAPVHLRYDPTVPGRADPSRRNGWIGIAEARNYPQRLDLTPDAKAVLGPSQLKGYSITTDGSMPDTTVEAFGMNPTYTVADLPEGVTTIKARAVSGAGVPADPGDIGVTTVNVDLTRPTASVDNAPSPDAWQGGAITLRVTARDQGNLSGMNGSLAGEPVEKGGYIEYRLDGQPAQQVKGPISETGTVETQELLLPISEDGKHTLTYKAVDFAGNESNERSIEFKIDKTPPVAAFEAQDADHPRNLSAVVADATSGVAGGAIEMKGEGGDWHSVPTRLDGDRLRATVDDSSLTAGRYEFRARVRDNAGNEAVSDRTVSGQRMVLVAPFRIETRLSVGIVKATTKVKPRKVSRRCRKSRRCMARVRKQRAKARREAAKRGKKNARDRTVTSMKVPYGKTRLIQGTLQTADGRPIAGRSVKVMQLLAASGSQWQQIGTVGTERSGAFAYRARKGASRTLRFVFDGDELLHNSHGEVKLVVPGYSSLRASRHRLRNGQSVMFRGTIGRPVGKPGKVIDLQAFYRHKWRTFATPRTDSKGLWHYRYRFEATTGTITYKFRVRMRKEVSYPYVLGYSPVVKVTVHGP
ncbi:MAG: Ig-like domain repeat protein [Thermoleophilaceae bacterium]|nr:Ig-like domain repeat protein [Thermoleophilaceae bacterium]